VSQFNEAVTVFIGIDEGTITVDPEIAYVYHLGHITWQVNVNRDDLVQIVFEPNQNGADPFAHDPENEAHVKKGLLRCTGSTKLRMTCDKEPIADEQDWVYKVYANGAQHDPIIKVRGKIW